MQGLNQGVCGSRKEVGKKNLEMDRGAMKVKGNRKPIIWRQGAGVSRTFDYDHILFCSHAGFYCFTGSTCSFRLWS